MHRGGRRWKEFLSGPGQDYIELQVSPANVVFDALFKEHRTPDWHEAKAFDIEGLKTAGRKAALALNKIDAMAVEQLLPLAEKFNGAGVYEEIFMISALKGNGLEALSTWCEARMPEGPFLYPPDQAADIPSRLLASEITREKIYLRLHDELPYATAVETEKWEDRKDGSVKIDQIVYVQRDGQKAIVLGKKGEAIKGIGAASRRELEQIFGRRVHLFLFVKVRPDWADKREHYRDMGLEFPEDK